MSTGTGDSVARERSLLDAARSGDERAFRDLVEPLRGELHAHCYRLLGSLHDAEDAFQDTLLRAWRGLPGSKAAARSGPGCTRSRRTLPWTSWRSGRSACCRSTTARRRVRTPAPAPLLETAWIEPYPDEPLGLADGYATPEARYEQLESVELAFVAALQYLPAASEPSSSCGKCWASPPARSPTRSRRPPPR